MGVESYVGLSTQTTPSHWGRAEPSSYNCQGYQGESPICLSLKLSCVVSCVTNWQERNQLARTESGLLHSDPISANENSSFQFDQELGESAGLYKPAVPDPQHQTWAYTSAATRAKPGPPSPSRNLAASSAGVRRGTGIIYPLQPRSLQPDVCIEVEATSPEPAALLRPDLQQQPTCEAPTSLSRPSRRHCRKRRRNRSTAIYRPPNAHLHGGTGVIYKHLN